MEEGVDARAAFPAEVFEDEAFGDEADFFAEVFAGFFELEDDDDASEEVAGDFAPSDCAWTNVPHAKRPVRNIAKRNPNHRL